MALVLADRVQQTGTANTTVSFTLSGSVTGFQSFSVVGNGNTTYYSAFDASGNWEVGVGTYATGGTLTRTTIASSSNSGSAVTFSGSVNVFLTYPAEYAAWASNNPGTTGTVLTSNGTGVAPSWNSAAGTITTTDFTATASQTTFTVSYTPGLVSVYQNGAKLAVADYTATNGTSIVLATGATVGDLIEIQAFNALSLSTVVNSFSAGSTGLTPSSASTGAVTLAGTLAVANGGTGNTSGQAVSVANALTAGTNISFSSGTTYNGSAAITINASVPTQVYPGVGIANSTGSAWGTSYSTTGSGTVVALATSPSFTTPILGTPTSGNFSTGTFTWPTFNQNTSGTAAGLSATLAIASGGTNSTATATAGGAGYGTGTAHAYTAAGTSGNALISAGAGAPAFGNLALGTANTNVSGALTATNGGTGVATLTGIAKGNGTSAFTAATSGTDYSAGTSALGTGILKSTTTTGALTIAVAADFPTLNQNTTGSAGSVANALTAGTGISFSSGTTYNGSAAITISSSVTSPIPAGTVMLFYQSGAPTGWTQVTTLNDYGLRLVSGAGGTTGGTTAFSTVFANQTPTISNTFAVGATTLSTTQIPSHTHGLPYYANAANGYLDPSQPYPANTDAGGGPLYTGSSTTNFNGTSIAAGGGSSHTHSITGSATSSAITLNVLYANIIICSKN